METPDDPRMAEYAEVLRRGNLEDFGVLGQNRVTEEYSSALEVSAGRMPAWSSPTSPPAIAAGASARR